MIWSLFQNSLWVACGTMLCSVALGFLAGIALATWSPASGRLAFLTTVIAAMIPPFLMANFWLDWFGNAGVLGSGPQGALFTPWGVIAMLTLLLWPIPALLTAGSLTRIDLSLVESDGALAGTRFVRHLLWPAAKDSLIGAAVIVFTIALNHFSIPALLQVKVLSSQMWVSFSSRFDYAEAFLMALPLVLTPAIVLWALRGRTLSWPGVSSPAGAGKLRRQLGRKWWIGSRLVFVIVAVSGVLMPLGSLGFSARSWVELPGAFSSAGRAVAWTLGLSSACACLLILLGGAASRIQAMRSTWIFFLTPGVFLGIALTFSLNHPWSAAFFRGAGVLVLALVLRYIGPAWELVSRVLASADRELVDTARLSGASRLRRFIAAELPQAGPSLAATWYLLYLFCLWEVETLVLILPPGIETIPVRIFNLLHYGHNDQVNALCLILVGLSLLPWALWSAGKLVIRRPVGIALSLMIILMGSGCGGEPSRGALVQSQIFERVEVIGSRGTGPGQFNKPRSVEVDAKDNLYVVDMTGRVQKFSPKGEYLLSWQMPQTDKGKPKGMSRDKEGHIILVEPHYTRVNHFSETGALVLQWGTFGTNYGQLAFPRGVAVNSKGDIFISEYSAVERVQRFDSTGKNCLALIGRPGLGAGEFNRAEGIGIDGQDNLYVADSCNHRIQIFDSANKYVSQFGKAGAGPGELSYPYDVRVDRSGRQYVCEFGNSRIQIFDATHHPIESLGGPGFEPGRMANPWGIALDSAGNLYVADALNHRVQKFTVRSKEKGTTKAARNDSRQLREGKS